LIFSGKYNNLILTGEEMIKDHLTIMDEMKGYASPRARLTRMLKSGTIIQVRRGLFVDNVNVSRRILAPIIYGPSYLSFQYALHHFGLIPERVNIVTSATYNKNKDKMYHTPLGDFKYYYLPCKVYPYGIMKEEEDGFPYLLASPEKALCDTLYKTSGINTIDDLELLLFDDWRMEREELLKLDSGFISFIAPLYHRRPLVLLERWFRRENNDA